MATFNFSRSGFLFRVGHRARMGFAIPPRICSACHLIPERARERLLDLAATQLPSGGAYHQYQPLTKRGNNDVGKRLQRRSALAGAGDRRLPQGDRRLGILDEPRLTTTSRAAKRPSTSTCSAACNTPSTAWGRMACRSSGAPTGMIA